MNIVKFIYQKIFHSCFVFWKGLALPRRVIISKGLFTIKAWLFVVFYSLTLCLLRQAAISIFSYQLLGMFLLNIAQIYFGEDVKLGITEKND